MPIHQHSNSVAIPLQFPSRRLAMSFRNLKAATFALLTLSLISSNAVFVQAADAKTSRAANLAATVTIYRDTYGVPHIYAKTDAGCVFGYFYAQCEDNFWQVEDNY